MNDSVMHIERLSPHTCDEQTLDKVIRCYQEVFAGPPWNESWPYEQVRHDLLHEITPHSSAWLARNGDGVVGFCWGYSIEVEALERKLGIPFSKRLRWTLGKAYDGLVAYQDELGVIGAHRGKKVARELFIRRLDDFEEQGLRIGIVRTRQFPEASVTFSWFVEKLGYHIIARYPGEDGRVVLAQDLNLVRQLVSK